MNTIKSGSRTRRVAGAVAAMGIALIVAGSLAGASSVHYLDGPNFSTAGNVVTASGTIAGLGNKDVTVTVSATATTICTNRGSNVPPGQTETVSGTASSLQPKNGSLTFSVSTGSPSNPCPAPMKPSTTFSSAVVSIYQGGRLVLQTNSAL